MMDDTEQLIFENAEQLLDEQKKYGYFVSLNTDIFMNYISANSFVGDLLEKINFMIDLMNRSTSLLSIAKSISLSFNNEEKKQIARILRERRHGNILSFETNYDFYLLYTNIENLLSSFRDDLRKKIVLMICNVIGSSNCMIKTRDIVFTNEEKEKINTPEHQLLHKGIIEAVIEGYSVIEKNVFLGNFSLNKVTLSQDLREIRSGAFSGTGLKSVVFKNVQTMSTQSRNVTSCPK